MSSIKNLRKKMGLSQGDLGIYSGVSQSLISKAEKAERVLPTDALTLINMLSNAIQKPAAIPPMLQSKQAKKEYAKLGLHIKQTEVLLQHTQDAYAKAEKLYQATLALLPTLNQQPQFKQQKLWLQAMQAKAKFTMQANNVTLQNIIAIKLNSLKSMQQQVKNLF